MDFLGIGFSELMFILIIAMMVFGPKRLPELAGKAGKIVRDLRGMSQGLMAEWQRELNVSDRLEELKEIRQELEETKKVLTLAKKEIETETTAATKVANEAVKFTEEAVKSMSKAVEEKPKTSHSAGQLPEPKQKTESVVAHENGKGTVETFTKKDAATAPELQPENNVPEPIIDARLAATPQNNAAVPANVPVPVDPAPEATAAEAKEVVNEQ